MPLAPLVTLPLQKRCIYMKRNLIALLFFCCSAFAGVGNVRGQHWTRLRPPTNARVAPYFLNQNLGFIYIPYGNGIFRTIDGGMTWNSVDISNNAIRQLY